MRPSLFLFLIFVAFSAHAKTLSESFTSRANMSSSELVWNIALGELHPPLLVLNWDDGGGAQSTSYDVGTGEHGAFILSRYSQFSQGGNVSGNVVRLNTDTYTELLVTSFNLASGWTLRPVGSRALVIRSQSTVVVDGTIDCSGGDGQDAVASVSSSLSGGSARCGGGDGGNSVPAATLPNATHLGVSGGPSVSGGGGGDINLATGGQGGGGGGAYIKDYAAVPDYPDPEDGDDSSGGSGGGAGVNFRDDSFSVDIDGAGSGGGGGSAFDDVGDPGNHSSGASGGAGGGTVRIYAVGDVNVSVTGIITSDGGAGGAVGGGDKGGAGGGGGGGSILIFSGNDIVLDGAVTALAGSGGATAGGVGGDGAYGRTWVVEKDGFAGGGMVEEPVTQLSLPGDVRYETGVPYEVLSDAIDIGNTKPTLTAAQITVQDQAASVVDFEIAFNDSSSLGSFPAFVDPTTLFNLEQKRFVRFRIAVDQNTDAVTPIRIQGLTLTYDSFTQNDFDFTTSCGSVNRGSGSWQLLSVMLMLLPFLVFLALQQRRRAG